MKVQNINNINFKENIITEKRANIIQYPLSASVDYFSEPELLYNPQAYNRVVNAFENYDSAQKIFRKNLEEGKGIFGSPENADKIIDNEKIRRNVVKFFAQYSQEEIEKLDNKKILTIDEARYKNDLINVRNFFGEYERLLKQVKNIQLPEVAFAGKNKKTTLPAMSYESEKACKNIVHGFSAACGLVSAALGEGAAIGADTIPLRMIQLGMFSTLAAYLKVPPIPSLEYYTKEMFAGATLGVGGAKLVTSWLGIGAHTASVATGGSVVTGGSSNAAITGGVRAVNSALSTMITEKMGRGYINRVKANKMNLRDQSVETVGYFAGRYFFTGKNPFNDVYDITINDTSSPELIKKALDKIPRASQEAMSCILEMSQSFAYRSGYFFISNFILSFFGEKVNNNPKAIKERAKELFKQSLIQATVYELCDQTVSATISKEAQETIKDMQENLEKYPDVYKVFIEKEHEFFEQINIDSLSGDAFTRQFKNRTFVYNLQNFSNAAVREFMHAWVNRKNAKNAAAILAATKGTKREQARAKEIDNILNNEQEKEVAKKMNEINSFIALQKDYYKSEKGFGYGRIAGYEKIKDELTQKFIMPLGLEAAGSYTTAPSAILLYGPTGVGKTELSRAVSEQGKCLMPRFKDPDNIDELSKELENIRREAKNASAHTVIKIDEFDDYGSDKEAAKIFAEFIKNCAEDKITLILTTNEPLDIDKSILKQTINIPILPPDKSDMLQVIKFYFNEFDNHECNMLADALIKKAGNNAYSNSQIKYLSSAALYANSSKNIDNVLELVKKLPPEITKTDIEKVNKEEKELQGLKNNENIAN